MLGTAASTTKLAATVTKVATKTVPKMFDELVELGSQTIRSKFGRMEFFGKPRIEGDSLIFPNVRFTPGAEKWNAAGTAEQKVMGHARGALELESIPMVKIEKFEVNKFNLRDHHSRSGLFHPENFTSSGSRLFKFEELTSEWL